MKSSLIRGIKEQAAGISRAAKAIRGRTADGDGAEPPEHSDAFNAAQQQYDPSTFSDVRSAWVRRHMSARASDYTTRRPLDIGVTTWNVAGRKAPDGAGGLAPALQLESRADLYVVGLQVVDDTHASTHCSATRLGLALLLKSAISNL